MVATTFRGVRLPAGLVAAAKAALLEPLVEPFHPERDTTVEELGGRWRAKLDWMLMEGLERNRLHVASHGMGGGTASDHQYLRVDLMAIAGAGGAGGGGSAS